MLMSGLWEKANEVSEIGYKVHSAAMIVELVAERITDNAESGALWAASELLQELSERLEDKVSDLTSINRKQEERIRGLEAIVAKHELKKGKKK
jgi:phage gp29-like protein